MMVDAAQEEMELFFACKTCNANFRFKQESHCTFGMIQSQAFVA